MTKQIYLSIALSMVLVMSILIAGQTFAYAADQFTLDTKSKLKKIKDPVQYLLVASANGLIRERKTSVLDPPSGSITLPISIPFSKVNDKIVTAGFHDEYFACGYVLSAKTGLAKKYKCNEGDLLDANGKNSVPLEDFRKMGEPSGSSANTVKIKIKVPLGDRPDADKLKIVTQVRGEFKTFVKEDSHGKSFSHTFTFDRDTDIGKIQIGDLFNACVAGDELNPPEGNECEFKKISTLTGTNTLAAR